MEIKPLEENNFMYVKGSRYVLIFDDGSKLYYNKEQDAQEDYDNEMKIIKEVQEMQDNCKHESSCLEPNFDNVEYESEEKIIVPVKDTCNYCGKLLNNEKHIFTFSHIEQINKEEN